MSDQPTNQLAVFDYSGTQVRSLLLDGVPWFVAADVARILGYRDAHNMARRLEADEQGYSDLSTPGGDQRMLVCSESGLYAAVFGSQLPDAKAFRKWVTTEVIPSIRRTGGYAVQAPAVDVASLDRRALALMVIEAEDARAEAESKVAELAPRAEAWDTLATADGDYAVADAAKVLTRAGIKVGRDRLFTVMADRGWIYRQRGDNRWRVYQTSVERGWLSELPSSHYHPRTGELVLDPPQVRVTVKGLERLRTMMLGGGSSPAVRA